MALTTEIRNTITAAAKAGKLTAHQAGENGFAERFAERYGLPALEELIANIGPAKLTAEERHICERVGTDPARYAAEKASLVN